MTFHDKKEAFLTRVIPYRGKKPFFLEIRSSELFILIAVCWSVFTVRRPSLNPLESITYP